MDDEEEEEERSEFEERVDVVPKRKTKWFVMRWQSVRPKEAK